MNTWRRALGSVAMACSCSPWVIAGVAAVPATQSLPRPPDMHNLRYCEVMPVFRDGTSLTVEVYSTVSLNDCPAGLWGALQSDSIAARTGAAAVKLNGPRYWLVNRIDGGAETAAAKVGDFGGIQMRQVATLQLRVWQADAADRPYEEQTVPRSATWVYHKGARVYELRSPRGEVYVMQSYTQAKDARLTLQALPQLGTRLALPAGWSYRSRVLEQELVVRASERAFLVQDELKNSYVKLASGH